MIPAHDEELDITDTVRSCQSQDYPKDFFEIIVIADNCLDSTAALARQAGATVVERHDDLNRSKGHALRFLFDRLEKSGEMDRTDPLVIIDSDTVVDAWLLRGFARRLEEGHDWIQAYDTVSNHVHPGEPGSWRIRSASSTESGSSTRTHWDSVPASVEMGCACPSAGSAGALADLWTRRRLGILGQLRVQGEMIVFAPRWLAMRRCRPTAARQPRTKGVLGIRTQGHEAEDARAAAPTRQLGLLRNSSPSSS